MKKLVWNLVACAFIALMLCCGNMLVAIMCVFGMLACLHQAEVVNVWEVLKEE